MASPRGRGEGPSGADAYTWGLDLDGVIWNGTDPIAGSAEAVADLRAAGHEVVFVTNNSFSTIAQQEAKLSSFGIDATGSVITSAQAGASLVEPGERALVLGGPGVIEALTARDVELVTPEQVASGAAAVRAAKIDAVVVGLDWELDFHRLGAAVQMAGPLLWRGVFHDRRKGN